MQSSSGKPGPQDAPRPGGHAAVTPTGRSGEGAGSVLEQLIQQERLRHPAPAPEAPQPEGGGRP
jgi:hypothetical protein